MIVFAPEQRETMEERARASASARRASSSAPIRPPAKNINAILTLGDETFFVFRGRPYGVPNPPWKVSEIIDDLYTRALGAIETMRQGALHSEDYKAAREEFKAVMPQIAPLLWKHSRPVGWWRRSLRALGLLRNPFEQATDQELMRLIDFFWRCRMKSGVQFPMM